MQSKPPSKSGVSTRRPQQAIGFGVLFLTVAVITIGCIAASIAIAIYLPEPTAYQKSAFDGLAWAWKLGFGAILGLLGGKIAR